MNDPYRIFVDSDVIISSLLSTTGASYLLLHHQLVNPVISNYSAKELVIVIKRLGIEKTMLNNLMIRNVTVVTLKKTTKNIQKNYAAYVYDIHDAHIIAGAIESKAPFLISYNVRHYKCEKIKRDFGIIVYTPAMYLQYLRSL